MAKLVSCTEKLDVDSPYKKIKSLGGTNPDGSRWKRSIERVINEIEAGEQTYYVSVNGTTPNLVVDTHENVKYVKTPMENDGPVVLIHLPNC